MGVYDLFMDAIYYQDLEEIKRLDSLYHKDFIYHEFLMESSNYKYGLFDEKPLLYNFLVFATKCNKLKSLEFLLDLGYRSFYCEAGSVLSELADYNHSVDLLKRILDLKHNPEGRYDSVPPLMAYISMNKLEHVKVLLQYGANPNSSHGGITPLMWCCFSNNFNLEIFLALTDAGADVRRWDFHFETFVDYASRSRGAKIYIDKFKQIYDNKLTKEEIRKLFS